MIGLTASVWTKNVRKGEELGKRLRAGVITINNHAFTGALPGAPWSGALETRQARLGLADGSLDAHLSAHLGDGRSLVALVPSGPPKWIAGLLDLRDFEASGRLRAVAIRRTVAALQLNPGLTAMAPEKAYADVPDSQNNAKLEYQ